MIIIDSVEAIKRFNSPYVVYMNFEPSPLPVTRAIAKLGADVSLARRRRRITQHSLAERIGASVSTVKRIEGGDARVPIQLIARTLHVLGEIDRLGNLLDTEADSLGLALMDEQLPKRIRARKSAADAKGRGAL